ncbi:MAG: pyridoxal 5'-phosphate synthase glutaminase subunit PdxT [Lachnospiraceae bacterium]|nr:pyridoxal 5'-phosphate synthase glutaminase subunit PdxT [Lachnospiraceae bacterium]
MKIGILAVQGAFIEHERMLQSLGCDCVEIRQKSDLCRLDGLVLPGGESTVQGRLLRELDLFEPIKEMIQNGLPVLATCAGLILLAEDISNDSDRHFQTLPVTVKRNAYGRQLGSFVTRASLGRLDSFEMVFIRAPYIEWAAPDVEILSTIDEHIVGVKYKNQIGLAFHPELSCDKRLHESFVKLCQSMGSSL